MCEAIIRCPSQTVTAAWGSRAVAAPLPPRRRALLLLSQRMRGVDGGHVAEVDRLGARRARASASPTISQMIMPVDLAAA